MRLAISNIAWDVSEDEGIVGLLHKYEVNAIDVAPGKYFLEPAKTTDTQIAAVRSWWCDQGIEITGMQSLLFGTVGLNVFGPRDVQQALFEHLGHICRIGAGLGATRLVFGSPKNRDRTGLSDEQAFAQAETFFRRLGDIAEKNGVIICLEPNPVHYGANFMTTSEETEQVVRHVNHAAIRMQLDTGSLVLNNEPIETVLPSCVDLIGHIHASEPDLLPLGDVGTKHDILSNSIASLIPNHIVSIEMVATTDEPHLNSIERALICATQSYRHSRAILS